ncbi:hypothetical protein [Roseibium sp.]|uniref:hypothetical protein n=1 Tax=Roseibium sp. TaxID=1936156 RepID=UPI003B52BB43
MKKILVSCLIALAGLPGLSAQAQSAEAITVQLNTAETAGDACRLTFVIKNDLAAGLDALGFDLVTFDPSEGVSGYAAVNFGTIPPGKTVVRQYDVGNGACAGISRVLLNEVRVCEAEKAAVADCLSKLSISSRSDIDFIM